MNKSKLIYTGISLFAVALIVIGIFLKKSSGANTDMISQVVSVPNTINISVETVGQSDTVGTSWSGEIISAGNVEIRPQREGTIVEWKVNIGQQVSQGQVLAQLSAPPITPELAKALAEQAQSLARAQAQALAMADFNKKNVEQLNTLDRALHENLALIGSTINSPDGSQNDIVNLARIAISQLQIVVDVKKQNLRTIMEQILKKHVQKFANVFDLKYFSFGRLRYGLGVVDSNSQSNYETRAFDLINALKDSNVLPVEVAQNYTQAAIRLVSGSITNEGLSQVDLDDYRKMTNEDQTNLLKGINEYEEAKSNLAAKDIEYKTKSIDYKLAQLEKQKDYSEHQKEINQKISELDKELKLAQAEVEGARVAYDTISNALTGGLSIAAPRAGTISMIMKKNGNFVSPDMAVASINAGNEKDRIVRFRIPGNIAPPKTGQILSVVRPGFGTDVQKVQLIGVGSSIDSDGSYMADAVFTKTTQWSIGASVRIFAPTNSSTVLIKNVSVIWSEGGVPTVWAVSVADRIFAKKITIGRTIGDSVEVYTGLKNGDRYISDPAPDIKENMFLSELIKISPKEDDSSIPDKSGEDHHMKEMQM